MSTEAQKARNARKRAKLKLHKAQAKAWRDVATIARFRTHEMFAIIVSVRVQAITGTFTYKRRFICEGDPFYVSKCAWHPTYQNWLKYIVSSFALPGYEVIPGSLQVQLVYSVWYNTMSGEWARDYPNEDLYDVRLDLRDYGIRGA